MNRAFTLLELLVAIAVIATLAGVSVPVYAHVVEAGRAAACVSNLGQLGTALNLYLGEHNLVLPTLQAGRTTVTQNVPVIDNTLDAYAVNPAVFGCPADNAHLWATTGTSYYWNVALNGQALSSLHFLVLSTSASQIPVLADKQAFHPYTQDKVNLLYADGHATQDVTFVAGDHP